MAKTADDFLDAESFLGGSTVTGSADAFLNAEDFLGGDQITQSRGLLSRIGSGFREGFDLGAQGMSITADVLSGSDDLAATIAGQNQRESRVSPEMVGIQERIQAAAEPSQGAWGRGEYLKSMRGLFDTSVATGREFINDPVSFAEFSAQALGTSVVPIGAMIAGAIGGSVVPGVGTAGGSIAGGFAGSTALEFGLWMQEAVTEKVVEAGGDPTDPASISAVLDDPEVKAAIMREAATKGLTHAAIGAVIDRLSVGLLRYKPKGMVGTVAQKGAAGGVQIASEGLEEMGSQIAATGDYDVADVAMEMSGGLGAGVSQTIILDLAKGGAAIVPPIRSRGVDTPGRDPNQPDIPEGAVSADTLYGRVDDGPEGVRQAARADAPVLSQDDIASPIDTQSIHDGRQILQDAMGEVEANRILQQGGVPTVNSRVELATRNGGTLGGMVIDAFDVGGMQGAKIRLDNGVVISETFDQLAGRLTVVPDPAPQQEVLPDDVPVRDGRPDRAQEIETVRTDRPAASPTPSQVSEQPRPDTATLVPGSAESVSDAGNAVPAAGPLITRDQDVDSIGAGFVVDSAAPESSAGATIWVARHGEPIGAFRNNEGKIRPIYRHPSSGEQFVRDGNKIVPYTDGDFSEYAYGTLDQIRQWAASNEIAQQEPKASSLPSPELNQEMQSLVDQFPQDGPVISAEGGILVRGPNAQTENRYRSNALPYSARVPGDPAPFYGATPEAARQAATEKSRPASPTVTPASETVTRQPIKRVPVENDQDTAVTASGREVPVRYAVVEAADLVASQLDDMRVNPDYPAEMQPRDRSRATSMQQVQDIATKLNPRLLDRSPRAADGAPIIAEDGVVESGNGRILAIRRAYQQNLPTADQYRDYLQSQGYNTAGMSQPVLVRIRDGEMTPADRQAFTREANERDTLGMSATERAMADATALPDTMLDLYRGGDVDSAANRPFVRAFIDTVVGRNEQASMIAADGAMSQEAIRRVEGALLAKAYGDADLVANLIESADTNIRAIGGALMDIAASWAQMRADAAAGAIDAAVDQTGRLLEAVRLVQRARRENRNVADFVGQRDMLSGDALHPIAEGFLRLMFRNTQNWTQPAGRDRIADGLRFYVDAAARAQPGVDLLGETAPSPERILDTAKERQYADERQAGQQQDLLAQPAGRTRERDGEGGRERAEQAPESPAQPRGEETARAGEAGTRPLIDDQQRRRAENLRDFAQGANLPGVRASMEALLAGRDPTGGIVSVDDHLDAAERSLAAPDNDADATGAALRIEDYSEKSIIIRGDTKTHKERIKEAGTRAGVRALWNRKAGGWIFAKTKEAQIREALSDLLSASQAQETTQPAADEEPNFAAARELLSAQREAAGNSTAEEKVRRKVRELASKTPITDEKTVMALDLIATRLGMNDLQSRYKDTEFAPARVNLGSVATGDVLQGYDGERYRIEGIDLASNHIRTTSNPDQLSERVVLMDQDRFDRLVREDQAGRDQAMAAPARPAGQRWNMTPPAEREVILSQPGGWGTLPGAKNRLNPTGRRLQSLTWKEINPNTQNTITRLIAAHDQRSEPATGQQRDGWREIGANSRGNPLFEDARGVRSYTENGIRVSESVGIIPGGGISINVDGRGNDFLTEAERAARTPAPAAEPTQEPERHATYGQANTVFTQDAAERAREILRRKLNQLNTGLDPEIVQAGITLAGYHIEAGARSFAAYSRAMIADLGESARPYLRSWYEGVRYYPGFNADGMSTAAEIETEASQSVTMQATQEVTDDGIQGPVPTGDARSRTADVQPAAQDRRTGDAPAAEGGRSTEDVRRADGERAETAERTGGAAAPTGSRAGRADDADRVPTGRQQRAERPAQSAANVKGDNYTIQPGALQEDRGRVQKARDNIRAIELMRQIEAEGRTATRAEQEQLARYVGWGGLKGAFPDAKGNFEKGFEAIGKQLQELLSETEYATARRSLQYAHYTAENVVRAMWDAAQRLGFAGGKVFEPGMGVGNFAGLMPADVATATDYHGLELDHTTARIARLLYPRWGVRQDDFTRAPLPQNTYDLVIGNPPFADVSIKSDAAYPQGFLLHDYFFAKSLDAVRLGGLLMFISSAGTMNKMDASAREYMADRADLVGAIRLPGNAFERNAGTSVTTDIVILRKRAPGEAAGDRSWTETVQTTLPNKEGTPTKGLVNRYFADNPAMVLGEEGFFDPLYQNRYAVRAPKDFDLDAAMQRALGSLPENVMTAWQDTSARAEVDFATSERKEGSFYIGRDGALMQQRDGVGKPVEKRGAGVTGGRSLAEMERIKALIPMRDALRAVYAADLAGDNTNAQTARERLNTAYDAFVSRFGPVNKAEFQYRRPTIIQQESARAEAREEARYAGMPWREGDFDATSMIEAGESTQKIARARADARQAAEKAGRTFDEGSFDPADMPDLVIEKRPNIDPFMDDPESYRMRAIEDYNDQTGEAKKTEVFFRNIITRERAPEIKSINDALLYTLNQRGRVDIPEIARLAGISESDTIEQLGEGIYRQPGTDNQWVTADEYLSGNVRRKLRQARAAAQRDPELQRNVDALEAAQPAPLPPSEINANLGMPWLPTDVIELFATQSLGLGSARVRHTAALGQWDVVGDTSSAAARTTWGTQDRAAPLLLQDALNRQDPRVYRETWVDGKKSRELDPVATEAAQEKVREIKQRFGDWVWSDPARANRLAELYNEEYNNLVVREYDGEYLTTPGISAAWGWRPHQKRVIARIIQSGNTYMAHSVGAGKTSAMIGAGMEMRRLGLVRKPMYVVPNHMLGQFTKEFYEQYPTARIAVADERRFHTDRRKQFIANVATDDLDAVIITHSAFGMVPISDTFQDGLIQEQIAQYRELLEDVKNEKGEDTRITRSRIEKQIERLEQRLTGKGTKRRDQVFTFEEMGADFLFVDEAHMFRKLDFATKMSNVKGISPEGSKASWDLYVKSRYLETINPGRNLVLASGTPVTNTMAELFTVSRYLQPGELRERGLEHFDSWAGAFGDTVTNLEQDASGGYKPVTRFAKFVNVPELSAMVRQSMDVVTSRQLEQYVTRPQLKGGKRQMNLAEKSEALEAYQQDLANRMIAIANRKGPPSPGDDIILSVINDGRHAAIDMRLVDPNLPNDPGSKLNLLVDNVARIWSETKRQAFHKPEQGGFSEKPVDKGPAAQMIFANLGLSGSRGFSVPDYIRAELQRRGVPKDQIAYIADYKTHVAKQRLFNDINEGKVRILIGSTAKMATGVNAQRRLYALHNLDPLWYPADDEQRNGRIIRQGNMNPEIEIHDYSTKGTYDSTMWGLMETKARFIQGFFEGDATLRDMEDLGEASQYEQAKAMTTNDPRLIELTDLRQQLERAQRRKQAFEREQYAIERRVSEAHNSERYYTGRVAAIQADIARRKDTSGDNFRAVLEGRSYTDRVEFGDVLLGRLELMQGETREYKDQKIGEIGGFDILADVWGPKDNRQASLLIAREDGAETEVRVSGSARGVVQSLEGVLRGMESDLEGASERLKRAQKTISEFEPQIGKQFTGQPEIDKLTGQVRSLERELAAETKQEDGPAEGQYQLAYHGTPYLFDRFSLEAVGKGEGNQAYGWGLYFAGEREVAQYYRKALTSPMDKIKVDGVPARSISPEVAKVAQYMVSNSVSVDEFISDVRADSKRSQPVFQNAGGLIEAAETIRGKVVQESDPGNLYQVDIPEDSDLLDWDKNLSEQPAKVKAALQPEMDRLQALVDKRNARREQKITVDDLTGKDIYYGIRPEATDQRVASMALNDLGIPGLRFLDAESRREGDGTRNFVIWDEAAITVEAVNDQLRQAARAAYSPGSEFAAKAEDITTDLAARLDKLGLSDKVALKLRDRIKAVVDGTASEADGRYLNRTIEVSLTATDRARTLNHEVIHALRDMDLFRAAEWRTLERAAKADTERMNTIRDRYQRLDLSEELIVEEAVAEMYADWAGGDMQVSGFIRAAFQRVRAFLKALASALRGAGFRTVDSVFSGIERGEVGSRQPGTDMAGSERFAAQQRQTDTAAFKRWFGDSKVVDAEGNPLVVYRGEHGESDEVIRSRLGSISFGSSGGASIYATSPNNRVLDSEAESPRVIPAYLRIENPIINDPTDPFIDAPVLIKALGREKTAEILKRFAGHVENTDNWYELSEEFDIQNVEDFIDQHPDKMDRLYVEAFHLLDDPKIVADIKAAGFDGAIHGGSGETALETEYKVFDVKQIKSAIGNRGTFDPANPDIRFALSDPRANDPTAEGGAQARQKAMGQWLGSQPLDHAFRIPFHLFGGINDRGEWVWGQNLSKKSADIITRAKFDEAGRFAWMNGTIEKARAGLLDRYGLDAAYVERERQRGLQERRIMADAQGVIESLREAGVGTEEAKVLQAVLTGESVADADMAKLAEPIRDAIDDMGAEAVELGLISAESFERNRGAYLHRVYLKNEGDQGGLVRWVSRMAQQRRRKIIGEQFKGRGLWIEVSMNKLTANIPGFKEAATGTPNNGERFQVLDRVEGDGQGTLRGIDPQSQGRTLDRVYIPEGAPIPDKYANYQDRGVWEIRGKKGGNMVLWRDFTKPERERMGEIVDARYTIAKTYMQMAHDLSTGRFFQDIALNEDWSTGTEPRTATWKDAQEYNRFWADPEVQWVKVPDTTIPKSNTKRYGALAGRWVRAEIWRDLAEMNRMNQAGTWDALLTQWKLNKTARSPVVHMNNIVSNVVLMDLADVRMVDLARAIRSMAKNDAEYREAMDNGAFGSDMVAQEIRRNVLEPVLEEIQRDLQGGRDTIEAKFGTVGKLMDAIYSRAKNLDRKMTSLYQLEDEVFRMATYLRKRSLGLTPTEAALQARDQFLNYDIRAPWINAARRSVLPFLSYTYRAVPVVAQSVMLRPWKLAKYMTVAYAANALAYMLSGGDEDEERRSLDKTEQGNTWVGAPRMIRMPYSDSYGNPVFLDVRRWMPAGDVFDMNQGHSAIPIPAPLQFGGPLMLGAELALNKQAFTGREITNDRTDDWWDKTSKVGDWAWKSWMPSAAWIPGSWYWERIGNAATGARDAQGRPYSLSNAIPSAVGIKLKPQDVQEAFFWKGVEFDRVERELRAEMRSLGRDYERGMLSQAAYERRQQRVLDKLENLGRERERTFVGNR